MAPILHSSYCSEDGKTEPWNHSSFSLRLESILKRSKREYCFFRSKELNGDLITPLLQVFYDMTYYHWAAEPVNLHRMPYPQMGHPKPNGLWFDVEGSWKQWCEAVHFRPKDLNWRHTVTLQDTSKILFLRNIEDIDVFTSQYGHGISGHIQPIQSSEELDTFACEYGKDLFRDILGQFSNYIMWGEVAGKYSGIIIDPYLLERSQTYLWYYGWNCSGGCIWDTSVARLGKPFLEVSHS